MGAAGKILAIIGAIIGALPIALYYVLPEIFSLWRFDAGDFITRHLGGFGFMAGTDLGDDFGPEYYEDILLLLVGVVIVVGAGLLIIGALTEVKALGIIGGLTVIAGPILLMIGLLLEMGDFADIADLLEDGGLTDETLIFGSGELDFTIINPAFIFQADWGMWIGTYIVIGGGVVGVIGGALV